jgi:thioredoxin-related protein
MNRTVLTYLIVGVVLVGAIYFVARKANTVASEAGGIQWTDIGTAVQTAQTQHKKIVVDVYTDWCTWCKTMDKQTYTDKQVADLIGLYFVPVKLNAESQSVRAFRSAQLTDGQIAQSFGVEGYPTTVFLNEDGSVIGSVDGYVQAEKFRTILQKVAAAN